MKPNDIATIWDLAHRGGGRCNVIADTMQAAEVEASRLAGVAQTLGVPDGWITFCPVDGSAKPAGRLQHFHEELP